MSSTAFRSPTPVRPSSPRRSMLTRNQRPKWLVPVIGAGIGWIATAVRSQASRRRRRLNPAKRDGGPPTDVALRIGKCHIQIFQGLVTVDAASVPVRTILNEWAKRGGTKVVGAERVPYYVPVEEIMSSPVIGIDWQRPITEAADMMEQYKTRHLAVLNGGSVVGILSVRDLLHPVSVDEF